MRDYSFFVARRMTLGSPGGKSSPGVRVATMAVALSVAVMLASIAVVTGFKREIRDKVVGFNSHLTVTAVPNHDADNFVRLTPTLRQLLDSLPFIKSYSVDTALPAIIKTSSDFKGVYIRNLDNPVRRKFIADCIEDGSMPDYSASYDEEPVVISAVAARQLGLECGQTIELYFINDSVKVRRVKIAGIFNSHFDAYDDLYLYSSSDLVGELAGIKESEGTMLSIDTDDFDNIASYHAILQKVLVDAYSEGDIFRQYNVSDAMEQGAGYFRWLALLDTNVVVIISLMLAVAMMTLIGGMLIIILDKQPFIGLMKALGSSTSNIRRVFIYLALRVTAVGLIFGNVLVISIVAIQEKTHFIPLDADAYYIDFVPVELRWEYVAILNAGVMAVAWLTLMIPSRMVSRIAPAKVMRDEEAD